MTRNKILLALGTAAVASLLGAFSGGSGGTFALWSNDEVQDFEVHVGSVHFAVGEAIDPVGPLPGPFSSNWSLPTDFFGNGTVQNPYVTPSQTRTTVVQLDAQAQGNRGLSYSLMQTTLTDPQGSGYLASLTNLKIIEVDLPAECTETNLDTASSPLYDGSLSGASFLGGTLVSSAYSTASYLTPVTKYLCLGFTVPATLEGAYKNVGSVQATTSLGVNVLANDQWNAAVELPSGAFNPSVSFTFNYQTFR